MQIFGSYRSDRRQSTSKSRVRTLKSSQISAADVVIYNSPLSESLAVENL